MTGDLVRVKRRCPFDGAVALVKLINGPLPYIVECTKCKARTARFRLQALAVAAWERRA